MQNQIGARFWRRMRMSLEDNKVMVQRFIDEVMNSGRFAAIAELCVQARGLRAASKAR